MSLILGDMRDAACESAAWRVVAKEAAEDLNHSLKSDRRLRGRSGEKEVAFWCI